MNRTRTTVRRVVGGSVKLLSEKQSEIDRLAHLEISNRRRMDAIAAVVSRTDEIRIRWAAHDLVKIDHAIKARLRANPFVDLMTYLRFRIVPTRIVRGRLAIMPRDDRDTDHLNPFGFDA